MKKYSAVLFDLEGTLVDFQWRLEPAAKQIKEILTDAGLDLEKFGKKPDYATLFNTTRQLTEAWTTNRKKTLFEKLAAVYDAYDADALSRWQPYPDTLETLSRLTADGCRMGVVTNCGRTSVDTVLERFDLLHFFECVISRNEVLFVKPDPDGLIRAAGELEMEIAEILFVGDSVNDILPARKIGMPSCFLACGESRVTGDTRTPATHQVSQLRQVPDLQVFGF